MQERHTASRLYFGITAVFRHHCCDQSVTFQTRDLLKVRFLLFVCRKDTRHQGCISASLCDQSVFTFQTRDVQCLLKRILVPHKVVENLFLLSFVFELRRILMNSSRNDNFLIPLTKKKLTFFVILWFQKSDLVFIPRIWSQHCNFRFVSPSVVVSD